MTNTKKPRIPRLTRHKATGQAVVRLSGKDHYCGRYGTAAARAEYDRLLERWLANGRRPLFEDAGQALVVEEVRLVSDQGGTIWDTVFTTRPMGEGVVELEMVMDARAYKLPAKLLNPLIKGFIRKAIEKDLDAVKAHCEAAASPA